MTKYIVPLHLSKYRKTDFNVSGARHQVAYDIQYL